MMIIPDWISALDYPGMFWIAAGILCGVAAYLAMDARRCARGYDASRAKDSDDDLGIGA